MAILAGCGLIYEYLLSHYAGRVLGAIEQVIFSMIGVMIVSMGIGAFVSRIFKSPFTAFAWLEVIIALCGSTAVLILAGITALANIFPSVIAEIFNLPPDLVPQGGVVSFFQDFAEFVPYIMGFLLGGMIGMEIPLMARIREKVYDQHLEHNVGSIYGADYIGAGAGAAIWVWFMLSMDAMTAAVITASINIVVGLLFYFLYRQHIRFGSLLLSAHIAVIIVIIVIAQYGNQWDAEMEDMMYQDKVIYRMNTQYQHITVTERIMNPAKPPVMTLYLNGRTQFSSADEKIYHSMLVYPAMLASARHEKILIIGGGDGLALRDVLMWNPQAVTLLDLDKEVIDFFSVPIKHQGKIVNQRLIELNNKAFSDDRLTIKYGDAFLTVDELLQQEKLFDTIIIDLPDPSHPDLDKLYSARFYAKCWQLLAGDGVISIQSTSPYHAKNAFMSIGKTVKHAGYHSVEQYHHNVPSFGEWGWTIATKNGLSAKQRIAQVASLPIDDGWVTKGIMLGAFEFGQHFFDNLAKIKVNRLGSNTIYQYHHQDWEQEQGIFE